MTRLVVTRSLLEPSASFRTWGTTSRSRDSTRSPGSARMRAMISCSKCHGPNTAGFPSWGGVIRRRDLDTQVARLAEKGRCADSPEDNRHARDRGRARLPRSLLANGGDKEVLKPDVTIIAADGSMNRFGRALGTVRRRDYPMGMAARGYYSSPRSDDPFLESQLDLRDSTGATMSRLWMGVPAWGTEPSTSASGLLSTFKRWKHVNTTHNDE